MASLTDVLQVSSAGLRAQGDRMRVVAENIANADSTASTPGGAPYRRKLVVFQNMLDKETGMQMVKVAKRPLDQSPFVKKYDPSHPAADAQGYVQYPNVNPIIEMMDMREARRGYEANLDVIQISKSMLSQTINLLNK
jgi:flagellar basal-body rod protein FlgC